MPMAEKELERIVVVGDSPTCTGFRLAGVSESYIVSGRDAEKKIEELMARPEVGIIIINDNILGGVDWRLKKKIDSMAKPTVIAVPNFKGEAEQGETLKALVKRALGFELIK